MTDKDTSFLYFGLLFGILGAIDVRVIYEGQLALLDSVCYIIVSRAYAGNSVLNLRDFTMEISLNILD